MASNNEPAARLFTIEQANAMLPLVRAITADLTTLARDVVDRRQRLASFAKRKSTTASDPYAEELASMQQAVTDDSQRLQEFIEELRRLGLEPKGALDGLVDFPAMMDGKLIYLCWKLGEPEVTHWHDLDAGFAGRQSLVAGVSAGVDAGNFDSPAGEHD